MVNIMDMMGNIHLADGRIIKPKKGIKLSRHNGKWYVDGIETDVDKIPTED